MPNIRVVNVTPNARRSTDVPNIRVSKGSPFIVTSIATIEGSPMGLLLALTYSSNLTTTYSGSNQFPNVRIKTI